MPRFFFDIECDGEVIDRIKSDLHDLEAARRYALGMVDVMIHGREDAAWHVTVVGENDETLEIVKAGSGVLGSNHH